MFDSAAPIPRLAARDPDGSGTNRKMEIIADSGGIYGLYDHRDPAHGSIRRALEKERLPVVIPAPTLGEIDYLMRSRLGIARSCSSWRTSGPRLPHREIHERRRCALQ